MSWVHETSGTTNDNTTPETTNIVSPRHLDLEEAETSNLAHIESQHAHNDDGRSPPLGQLSILDRQLEQMHQLLSFNDGDNNIIDNIDNHHPQQQAATTTATRRRSSMSAVRPSFKHVARRIVLMQRLHHQKSTKHVAGSGGLTNTSGHTHAHTHAHTHPHTQAPSYSSPLRRGRHRKNTKSTAADLLDQLTLPGLTGPTATTGASGKSKRHSITSFHERNQSEDSAVFYSAGIDVPSSSSSSSDTTTNDFEEDDEDDFLAEGDKEDDDDSNDNDHAELQLNKDEHAKLHHGETLPMVMMDAHEYGAIKDGKGTGAGASFSRLPTTTMPRRFTTSTWKRWSFHCLAVCQTHPTVWARRLYHVLVVQSFLIKVVLPLHCMALALYYGAGNPEWEFLPTTAHSSWLLNFIARQFVTVDLARLSQWLLLDCVLLGSRTVAHFMGPIVTMTAVQSRGWPFMVVAWGCWDMLLLRGNHPFQLHWLSGILQEWRFYTVANSGRYILESDDYRRILLSLIVAGLVTTAKRMFLTVHFGRRMLVDFKPSLEKLLADIVLVNDIADLAVEASNLQDEIPTEMETTKSSSTKSLSLSQSSNNVVPARSMPKRGLWTSVNFHKQEAMAGSQSEGEDDDYDHDDYVDEEEKTSNAEQHEISSGTNHGDRPHLARSPSGSVLFKKRLEKWEEPQTKIDKSGDIAIQDVLKFKHALNYMDDKHPFGESFGRIMDRNDAIDSAHIVYHKLLKCSPDSKVLPFEILSWITYDEKDVQNEAKLKALRRLFHPDARGNLTLFAFVQSCDMVYKRLRYFKASVRNASVIDNELEKILNYFYCFVLVMVLLAIMQINPWPLLVSMTSLLVSVSFALGSSVSKYVEGIMLIAVRRPFDLGDRILINSTDSVDTPGAPLGWFVEDITLSSTTLRFSKTNEVATVSNFAMSQLKIVNCQRSPNAIVLLTLKLHIKIFEGDKLKLFREALEKYVRQNPRIWEQIVTFRHDHIGGISTSPQAWSPNNILDADYHFVIFTLCYQHRISWQSASRIMENRADLLRNIHEVCLELGVQYDNPAPRRMIVENNNSNFDPANAGLAPQAPSNPFGQTTVDPGKLF